MIHIADELLKAGGQDALLNVILICFQSPILMIQEITVQDRALTDFLPQNKMKIHGSQQRSISMFWI